MQCEFSIMYNHKTVHAHTFNQREVPIHHSFLSFAYGDINLLSVNVSLSTRSLSQSPILSAILYCRPTCTGDLKQIDVAN